MKKQILLTLLVIASCTMAFAQITTPPNGGNQRSITTQYIGKMVRVTIDYNSPDVTSPQGSNLKS